jgi:hypothetical protein
MSGPDDGTEFQCDCSIDPEALDIEWLEQPNVFLRYAEGMANARLEMDQAKEAMDVTKAQVDTEIRRGYHTLGVPGRPRDRLTETQVANLVIQDPKYRDAVDKYLTAKHYLEIISARVKALEQRKNALENLVKLNGQQYFASPMEPRNLGTEYRASRAAREETQSRLLQRMNRTR